MRTTFVLLLAAASAAQGQVVTSTFDLHDNGWTIAAFQPTAHTGGPGHIGDAGSSTLGNPVGTIRVAAALQCRLLNRALAARPRIGPHTPQGLPHWSVPHLGGG